LKDTVCLKAPNLLGHYLEACERGYLMKELTRHDWQMAATAQAVGISRKSLWERLWRLRLQPPKHAWAREPGVTEG
jgi:DNA-binding NtrC family response regulator